MTDRQITPAEESFDDLARSLGDGSLSRRRALAMVGASILGGGLGSLALLDDADAKKKKKKKKKKKNNDPILQPPVPPGAPIPVQAPSIFCANLGTACGLGAQTLVCNCRLSKEGAQSCGNIVNPPNGATFEPCQQSANCPSGQFCDFGGNVCRLACPTA
jgi:hypothetical protein